MKLICAPVRSHIPCFEPPPRLAGVRHRSYTSKNNRDRLFNDSNFPVDFLITPEQVVTDYIRRLVEQPGALQVLDFADGLVQLVAVRVVKGGASARPGSYAYCANICQKWMQG